MAEFWQRIRRRFAHYAVRWNKYQIASNRLRMAVYRGCVGMKIGRNTMIWAGNRINDPENLVIGDNCVIGPANVFLSRGGIKIGKNVNLSGYSYFISQQHDLQGDDFTATTIAPIEIHDWAWVATNCTIIPGVTIHEGGVVAAGAVVTKDVAPWTVAGGNPAKKIGNRKHQNTYTLKDLKGSKWL